MLLPSRVTRLTFLCGAGAFSLLSAAIAVPVERPLRGKVMEADVCVYGGTSGGVVAAVQAARMGKRVVLVEPGRHLGGLTSGGLSAVDIGDPRSVGGIAREYFSRLVSSYNKTLNWSERFKGNAGPATGGAYSIEPHVAERVFDEMVAEANVVVLREARLKSVMKDGSRIVALTCDDGRVVRAKMFIDTTYEGDLMAVAGVSYTLVREGNSKYGEHYNGIRTCGQGESTRVAAKPRSIPDPGREIADRDRFQPGRQWLRGCRRTPTGNAHEHQRLNKALT
jgi:flavin-dependent dehydrogenase